MLRMATGTRQTKMPCCPKLAPNGIGQISTIFLRCIRNITRRCCTIHQNKDWITPPPQIQSVGGRQCGRGEQPQASKDPALPTGGLPTSGAQVVHVARGILHGRYNVFPQSINNGKDPILEEKLRKGDGKFETKQCILGFKFDRNSKTI